MRQAHPTRLSKMISDQIENENFPTHSAILTTSLSLPPLGADDIFVFSDTWNLVRREHPNMPILEQLKEALAVGGKAIVRAQETLAQQGSCCVLA